MKNCKGDAKELKPTVMAGVPEVFERIRKNVIAQLEKQGFIARLVFNAALAFRSKLIEFNSTVVLLLSKGAFTDLCVRSRSSFH